MKIFVKFADFPAVPYNIWNVNYSDVYVYIGKTDANITETLFTVHHKRAKTD